MIVWQQINMKIPCINVLYIKEYGYITYSINLALSLTASFLQSKYYKFVLNSFLS